MWRLLSPLVLSTLLYSRLSYAFNAPLCTRMTSSVMMAGFGGSSNKVPIKTSKVIIPPLDASCPCGSGSTYGSCCEPYHSNRAIPPNPVAVVRSRFSALCCKNVQVKNNVNRSLSFQPSYSACPNFVSFLLPFFLSSSTFATLFSIYSNTPNMYLSIRSI